MANKLPQDRETIVFHFGDGDSSDPIITEEQIEHAKARERREAELRGLRSRMRQSRWHCCEDIAKNYDLGKETDLYRRLLADARSGKFDEYGLLFLNPDPRGRRDQRVTHAMAESMVEIFGLDIKEKNPSSSPIVVGLLRHCWMPDALYEQHYGPKAGGVASALSPPENLAKADTTDASEIPATRKKEKQGARPKYDWDVYEPMFYEQMKKMGDFDDEGQVSEWERQSDAEKWLLEMIEKDPKVGKGNGPVESTIRDYVSEWAARWRANKKADN